MSSSVCHQGQTQNLSTLEGFQLVPMASSLPLVAFTAILSFAPCKSHASTRGGDNSLLGTVYLGPHNCTRSILWNESPLVLFLWLNPTDTVLCRSSLPCPSIKTIAYLILIYAKDCWSHFTISQMLKLRSYEVWWFSTNWTGLGELKRKTIGSNWCHLHDNPWYKISIEQLT